LPATPQGAGVTDVDPRRAYGSKNAPITMEVFSDFQCPACKQLYKTTNQQLLDNYVNTGKVYLIHRDFPLPMHAYSRIAARYVRAASQLGKAEQAEKVLFDNQEKWQATGDVDGTLAAVFSASDMAKIRAQAKGTSLDGLIEKDVSLGKSYNVNQTPTTVFHRKGQTYPYAGVISYDIMKGFLDDLLSR
jgi:protein-disulfide isomerase